jgi:virulence factor
MLGDIRVVVIGAGRFADLVVLPVLKRHPNVEVVAIEGRTTERVQPAAALFGVPHTFVTLDALLQGPGFDAAVICTPPEAHYTAVTTLLQAGKDICCEKPLAPSLAAMEEMVRTAKARDRIFMAGMNRRYAPVCLRAKALFEQRRLDLCTVEKHKDSVDRRGLLHDGIHLIDFMRWVCGGVGRIVTAVARAEKPDREFTLTATVDFDSGPVGVFIMNRRAGRWIERMIMHGSGCTAEVQYPDFAVTHIRGDTTLYEFRPKDWAWAVDMAEKGGFQQELEDFVRCVQTRASPIASAEDAVESHRMVDAIYRQCGLIPLIEEEGQGNES